MAEASDKGGGFDWGGLLSGIGKTLSGTAAGLQGDNDYFNRLQTQMDNAAERQRRTKLAEDELKAREEDRAVTRSKNLMETLKMANDVADQIGGDPERAKLPARMLKTILEKNLEGGTIDEKEMQDFLAKGSGAFDGILAAYTGITAAGLDKTPGFQQALRKGKLDLKEWNKTGREQMSNVAYQAASQFAQAHPEDAKTMTWDQFQAKIPGAEFASEEDIYRLQSEHGYTFKAPAQLKKEKDEQGINERAVFNAQEAEKRQQIGLATVSANVSAQIAASDARQANALGQTELMRREAEQNAPLDIKATRWVHPETLKTASPDMSPVEAKKAGYSVVTPSLAAAIPSARVAIKSLDKYEELSKKLLVDTSKMNSTAATAAIQANRATLFAKRRRGDADVAEFDALQATLPAQVKAFGDTGNIAVKETEFAGKSLPNDEDSVASALRKTTSRRSLLKGVLSSNLSTPSGTGAAQKKNDPLGLR